MKKFKFVLEFKKEEDRKEFFKWFSTHTEWKNPNIGFSMYFKDGCNNGRVKNK